MTNVVNWKSLNTLAQQERMGTALDQTMPQALTAAGHTVVNVNLSPVTSREVSSVIPFVTSRTGASA
jgi:hypothetical protein